MKNSSPTLHNIFKGIRSVALIANGAIHDFALIAALTRKYDVCIAVDGGLVHCHAMHIRPVLLIGDFDSISQQLLDEYKGVPKESFPINKDETDMELAIKTVISSGIEKIGIFGALEKRTDHAVANLYLMSRYANKVIIETEKETLFMISGQRRVECQPGQTVSLIPLGAPAKGVTTQGLKWEIKGATLDTNFMSISNICLNAAFEITIDEGELICCLLRI